MRQFDVVVIGGASLDTVHLRGQVHRSIGGAGLYTALAAHRAGARTAMFAPRPRPMLPELSAAASCLHWMGPTVSPDRLPFFEMAHTENGCTMLNARWGAEALLSPADLPPEGLPARVAYCGPLANPASQLAFLEYFHQKDQRTACGTYGRAVAEHPVVVREMVALADIFFCNREEAALLFGELSSIRVDPGKLLFVTLGADGVLVVQGSRRTHVPGKQVVEVDPTGAGDTFCGSVLADLARGEHPIYAARRAVVRAAQAVTVTGPLPPCANTPAPSLQEESIVRVNRNQVSRIAELIAALPEIQPFDFTGDDFPPVGHPAALDFFFSSTLQQFGFWTDDGQHYQAPLVASLGGKSRKGSDYLWAVYRRWLDDEPGGLTALHQGALTAAALAERFSDDSGANPMPAFEAHLEQAVSYGQDMLALGWSPESVIDQANASERPLQTFLSLLDHVGGYKEDWLRKKSVLLGIILQQRPERFLRIAPEERVPPIIDYHLQRSCLRTGLIEVCDEPLRRRLTERQILTPEEEAAVRYAAYVAIQQLQVESGKSMGAVDWFFFGARRRCPEMVEPECHLCPIEPACVKEIALFQPVIRTTDY